MYNRPSIILLVTIFIGGITGCQTTSNSVDGNWRSITHQDSFITVLSDDFQVGSVAWKQTHFIRIDYIQLNLGFENVGGVELRTVTDQSYCGWSATVLDKIWAAGGFVKKYLDITGLSPNDVGPHVTRNKHGPVEYVELSGNSYKCVLTAQLTGGATGAPCGGSGMLRAAICTSASDEKIYLDKKVFRLLETVRVDGSGKELIR